VPLSSIGAITLFVEDLQRAKQFYEDVFDAPFVFEDENSAVFKFENTVINLLSVDAAPGLIEPAAVAAPEAGSRLQLTIWVDDTNAVCAELEKRGVSLLNGPVDRPWGMRTASFKDPGGHIWEVAQDLSQSSPAA
jgi:catechol 2,3-dioxygenase-like lactoylglutathione lyase family enzyme